ncbi:MAG: hypothetical protein ACLT98_13245 [Eggerthellaceae bacterium]
MGFKAWGYRAHRQSSPAQADMMPRLKENACPHALAERAWRTSPGHAGDGGQLDPGLLPAAAEPGHDLRRVPRPARHAPDQFKEDVKKQAEDMSSGSRLT